MSSLSERKFVCRVSSTLNRDTKQFGKKHLFDDREETCWNSDQVSQNDVLLGQFFMGRGFYFIKGKLVRLDSVSLMTEEIRFMYRGTLSQ